MPVRKIWLNLPVRDIKKSQEFFCKLGFASSDKSGPGHSDFSTPLVIGDNQFTVMLFSEDKFNSFTHSGLSSAKEGAELLISVDAESREEVDEYARKVEAAGGIIYSQPEEREGWMYGFGFSDLDHHRWNFLFMDFAKLGHMTAPTEADTIKDCA